MLLFNISWKYYCVTPKRRCDFHAGVSLNISSIPFYSTAVAVAVAAAAAAVVAAIIIKLIK